MRYACVTGVILTVLMVGIGVPAAGASRLCFGQEPTIVGSLSSETIEGTEGPDVILARAGNDTVRGGGGNDLICGNDGSDWLHGDEGNDRIFGGIRWDVIEGAAGDDLLRSNSRLDYAVYTDAPDPMVIDLGDGTARGEGDDTLVGVQRVMTSPHDDIVTGTRKDEAVRDPGGSDQITLGAGDDIVIHQSGQGSTEEMGRISLGPGDDFAAISGQNYLLLGGRGDDHLGGGRVLTGGRGRDRLNGGLGDDDLSGGSGHDRLRGARGDDELGGGAGFDRLAGGAGTDSCREGEALRGCE